MPKLKLKKCDHAERIVRHGVLPIIAAAFETYPELTGDEILELCVPALADRLREEFRVERRRRAQR